jgi:hypothetical protein
MGAHRDLVSRGSKNPFECSLTRGGPRVALLQPASAQPLISKKRRRLSRGLFMQQTANHRLKLELYS